MKKFLLNLAAIAAVLPVGLYPVQALSAEQLTLEGLQEIILQQGEKIAAQDKKIEELESNQDATAEAIEEVATVPEWVANTTIGGYGELHYNNTSIDANISASEADNQDVDKNKDEFDLHRFVLFFGHQFSDTVRFFSELEVEHSLAGDDKEGEVEVEQAFVEWDYKQNGSAKAGLFLLPVGILNETHEPDTFYGVERNNVEKNIIPTTWWEGGAALSGSLSEGLAYDFAVHSGLYIDVNDGKFKVRDGRQKVSKAKGDHLAFTGRLKYTGIAGLELAATAQHQSDVSQNEASDSIDANLYEVHGIYQNGPFSLRALYAMWDIDSAINAVADGADEQEGFFVEPSYKINDSTGVFVRYSEWDNQAGSGTVDSEFEQIDVGVNYWLTENVVFKADYQDQDHADKTKASDGFNLGVGWSF